MKRLVAIVVHNWPLKLAAIALATLLYAGLVLSQSAQQTDARVPIVPRNQPVDAYPQPAGRRHAVFHGQQKVLIYRFALLGHFHFLSLAALHLLEEALALVDWVVKLGESVGQLQAAAGKSLEALH